MVQVKYTDKLKDPRWQKLRLQVYDRDNFKCHCCRATRKELQIHHVEYIPGIEPWEYPIDMLLTLCVDCHVKERGRDMLERHLATTFKMRGFLMSDLLALSCRIDTNPKFATSLLKILRDDQRVD